MILKEGKGIIIYLRQEGRGIGFRNKLSCLALQEGYLGGKRHEKKYSPDEANLAFGYPVDGRDYKLAADFLRFLGLKSIDLISGNPEKISTLKKSGIIIENIVDISREDYTGRELREIEEKISRNYYYPRASDNLKREGSKDGK
jgi:GTP cyclohydrolase II